MPPTTALYSIRPARLSDLRASVRIIAESERNDSLMDILMPGHHEHAEDYETMIYRLYQKRYWTPAFHSYVVVDGDEQVVGTTWWKKHPSDLTCYETWISPYAWLAPIMRALITLRDTLFPLRLRLVNPARVFNQVVEPSVLNTPRRREAWYLSMLAITPEAQGQGLGSRLLRHGLQHVDAKGKPTWLIGLAGTETFYTRFGFKTVGQANVDELSAWDGGIVMMRE